MEANRIEWVDISKGVGILLVIVGHCVYYGGFVHNWIFSFHMQLFFVLSGLFFREAGIIAIGKKKFKQLIIPYIVFCTIGLCITLIIPQWRKITLKDIARDIYWGYPISVNVSSIWFLVCLFITILMFNCIVMIKNRNRAVGYILLGSIICYGFALARFPQILAVFPGARMPWESDSACVAILFLAVGYFFKDNIFKFVSELEKKSIWVILCGLLFSFGGTLVIVLLNGTVNLRGLVYNNEILYTIGSVIGFVFVVFASILIKNSRYLCNIIKWFGENSLKIMGAQAIIVRLYLVGVNTIAGTEYGLYLLPPMYAAVGIIVVTICSGVSVTAYNIIFKKIINKV